MSIEKNETISNDFSIEKENREVAAISIKDGFENQPGELDTNFLISRYNKHFDEKQFQCLNEKKDISIAQEPNDLQLNIRKFTHFIETEQSAIKYRKTLVEKFTVSNDNPISNVLLDKISQYQDVVYSFQDNLNDSLFYRIMSLHSINHVLTTDKIVQKNNKILSKSTVEEKNNLTQNFRDQGFCRPRVLIILPFKSACLKIVNEMIKLLESDHVEIAYKARFYSEFEPMDIHINNMEAKQNFPSDYKQTFNGNTDDCFRIGLKIKKNKLKLYEQFYKSDIIIASPLGLRTLIGSDGDSERDYDFLSSIQILFMHHSSIFMMQNWEHLLDIFKYLNLLPTDTGTTDFSRLYNFSAENQSSFYRQTILFSQFLFPELNGIVRQFCHNYSGTAIIESPIYDSISSITINNPLLFLRVETRDYKTDYKSRYDFFINDVIKNLLKQDAKNILIFIPSYVDYLKIKKRFTKEEYSFCDISEYSSVAKIKKNKQLFYHGQKSILIITERFYFYYRARFKNVKHIIFYQLPLNPIFYTELIAYLSPDDDFNEDDENCINTSYSLSIFSKYDVLRLTNIIGNSRSYGMITTPNKTKFILHKS